VSKIGDERSSIADRGGCLPECLTYCSNSGARVDRDGL
jgi:hypothetical protein